MNTIKCLGIVLAGALALGVAVPAANAADIDRDRGSYKDGPEYVPSITWTGFYVGGHIGAAFSDNEDVEIIDDAAFLAGVHLGFNWQTARNLVIGIEGDVSFLEDVDYLATVRGRLGYAFGPTLAYVTGGAAFLGFEEDLATGDDTDTGYVVGLGIERKIRDNISVGVEGLYYGFEGEDEDEDDNFWTARARLTYHFGGRDSLK